MAKEIIGTEQTHDDFADRRVFMRHMGDGIVGMRAEGKALVPTWECTYQQHCDGPTEVRLGRCTSDASLAVVATRCGVAVGELVAFRDGAAAGAVHEAASPR